MNEVTQTLIPVTVGFLSQDARPANLTLFTVNLRNTFVITYELKTNYSNIQINIRGKKIK